MSSALAHFLPEFGLPAAKRAGSARAQAAPRAASDPVLLEEIREEGRRQGRAAVEAELVAAHHAEISALKTAHAAEIEQLREDLSAEIAQRVLTAVSERSGTIADQIATDLADVLLPVLEEAVSARMMESLAEEVRSACETANATSITVTGPAHWLDAMRARLGAFAGSIAFEEAARADVELQIDGTRLKSRMEDFAASLREAMS